MSQESFSSAIQYWKSIQLVGLQKELDQQGLAIVENQKDGLVSRKKLAEQTRGKHAFFFLLLIQVLIYRVQEDTRRRESIQIQAFVKRQR
ncbi:hypothetical protein BD560DRAFT_166237 [Blakeslea trispora]|nr:hypothetical protein BD560DRAFT_166237 [Blakeslea trispora]